MKEPEIFLDIVDHDDLIAAAQLAANFENGDEIYHKVKEDSL